MPKYRMTFPYARQFATVGRVEPGGVVTAKENPDPNFFVEDTETAKAIEDRKATTTTGRRSRSAIEVVTPIVTEPEEAKP